MKWKVLFGENQFLLEFRIMFKSLCNPFAFAAFLLQRNDYRKLMKIILNVILSWGSICYVKMAFEKRMKIYIIIVLNDFSFLPWCKTHTNSLWQRTLKVRFKFFCDFREIWKKKLGFFKFKTYLMLLLAYEENSNVSHEKYPWKINRNETNKHHYHHHHIHHRPI